MTRYFFDLRIGQKVISDDTGTEFASLDQVRKAAQRFLPDLAREELPDNGDDCSIGVRVTDNDRRPVYSATLAYAGQWHSQ